MSVEVIFPMNLTKKVSTFFSYLVCLLAFSETSAQTLPNGAFDKTSFGPIEISCVSSALCFASYEDGRSFMYLTSPEDNDHFVGFWAEPDASQTCSAVHQFPNISTNAWGNVDIYVDFSGNSWSGLWGYCEEQPNREFVGARDQQATQENALIEGDLTLAERLVGSWLPTPDSGARRNDLYTFNPDSTYVISDGSSNAPPGTWDLTNAKLFLGGRPDPVPLEFIGSNIELAGVRYERDVFNDEDYTVRGILGGIEPGGVFMPNQQEGYAAPKVGDYALRYVVLGQAESFRPGASADAGMPVYVEFWNETEAIKEDEAGNGYRDDVVAFEATEYEVGPDSLIFHGYHPDWGDMYFSAQFDGRRVATQTSYELGSGPRPANADRPIIVGDMLVKGHIFRDVALFLAFLH
jgi:hypothetical protein